MSNLDAAIETLSNQLRSVQAQIVVLSESEQAIKAQIIEWIGEQTGEIAAFGVPRLTVSYSRRFSPDLAKQVLSPELIEMCKDETISASKAKRVLPASLYERCQKYSDVPTIKPKAAAA
jgi:hypothetical protein